MERPEYHINPSQFTDEELLRYHLEIQQRMAEAAIRNADCQSEWDIRYPHEGAEE